MASTSSTHDNLASNQSQAGASTSGHLVGQPPQPQMTVDQSDVGSSNLRQVATGEPQIQDNNTGSPFLSSPQRLLTCKELQMEMDKYTTRITEYFRNKTQKAKGKRKVNIDEKHQKKVSHYHQRRILQQVLMINEQCKIKGYVYGIVTENNKSVTGASDSLRAWWKEQAMFDKAAPAQVDLYYRENSLPSNVAQDSEGKSTTEFLVALSDPTLGSPATEVSI